MKFAPNNSFKPNLLRSTNNMAGTACHVVGSTTQVGLTQALAAKEVMELRFSSWYHWKSRNDYPGIAFPGIYVVLISEANVAGQPFSINDDVIYVGMTNAVAGLRGRLSQFDNTIAQRHCQHGGADRVLYKHQDYASLVSKLYVALWHVECTPAAETPMDLRAMGKICNAEYEVMAQCVEELGELPEFNRKKERPKFSLTHGRR